MSSVACYNSGVNKEKKYIYAIDALRVIAILAVVLIHTTTRTLERTGYNLNFFGWSLLLNQIPSFAVMLFFMISGYVLEHNYKENLDFPEYIKRRFNKIFIPYIFWSSVYYFFIYTKNSENFLTNLLTGDSSYQLYFIPSLMVLYFIFPLIHKIYKFIANRWVFIVLGLIELYVLYNDYYVKNLPFHTAVNYVLFNYFVFVVGMVAARNTDRLLVFIKKTWFFLLLISVYFAIDIFLQGKNIYFKTYNIDAFYSRHRPSILFYTLSLSPLLFYFFSKINFFEKVVIRLSRLSFFVFFVHVIVLEVVWKFYGDYLFPNSGGMIAGSSWFDPLFFVLTASVSFLIAYAVHRIPYLTKITG